MSERATFNPSSGAAGRGVGQGVGRGGEGESLGVPWFLWPNVLSLDAVAVAVVWMWAFSLSHHVPLLPAVYVALGMIVWWVYTADRLLDAWRLERPGVSPLRHQFAHRYFVPLALGCVVVLVGLVFLGLFSVSQAVVVRALPLGVAVVLYFVLRCSPPGTLQTVLPKEVFCGGVFALGTTCAVYAMQESGDRPFATGVASLEVAAFAVVCVLNCALISYWEREEDAANPHGESIVTAWPWLAANLKRVTMVFASLAGWLGLWEMRRVAAANGLAPNAVVAVPDTTSPLLLSASLGAALLGGLALCEGRLSKNVRRAAADLVLLSPLVVVPLMT